MINKQTLRDINLVAAIALPAAGANVNSALIDTANTNPGRVGDPVVGRPELLIELPATPSLADTKKVTITVIDSADGVTTATQVDIPAQVATGVAVSQGGAALTYQCKLPIGIRRYIGINVAVDAAGGNNTAVSATVSLVF